MLYVLHNTCPPVFDHSTVSGIGAARELVAHLLEAVKVGREVFEDSGAVSQDLQSFIYYRQ